jgi:aquaporin Z
VAALLLQPVFGPSLSFGASHPGPLFTPVEAALCEVVLTFALMLVILMTGQQQATVGKQAALAVGFTVAACGLAAGPISGASMNPARTIAPQILVGAYGNIWIYAVGPLVGSAIAVGVHALLSGPPKRGERKAARGQ